MTKHSYLYTKVATGELLLGFDVIPAPLCCESHKTMGLMGLSLTYQYMSLTFVFLHKLN